VRRQPDDRQAGVSVYIRTTDYGSSIDLACAAHLTTILTIIYDLAQRLRGLLHAAGDSFPICNRVYTPR